MNFLSSDVLISSPEATATAGTSTLVTNTIDMAGYTGCMCLVKFGTAAADNTLKASQSTDDSSYADLLGTSVGVGASDELVWLDIKEPLERYIQFSILRGTSTTMDACFVFKYGPREKPCDNTTAGTIHGEAHRSPIEGTA